MKDDKTPQSKIPPRPDLVPEPGWPEFIRTMRSAWCAFAQFRHGENPEPCLQLFEQHYQFSTCSTLAYMVADGEHDAWKRLLEEYSKKYGQPNTTVKVLLDLLGDARERALRTRHQLQQNQ